MPALAASIDTLLQLRHDGADVFTDVERQGITMPSEKGFFASRLTELRKRAGLSQPQLAEKSGVPVSTIRQFEQGRREPTYGTLTKLASGLGLSLSAFDPVLGEPPAAAGPAPGQPPQPPKPRGRGRKEK
jgi:DNA-binding XRE family transcriptional regulator